MKTEQQFWTKEMVKKFVFQECNKHNTWDEEGLNLYLEAFETEELNPPQPILITEEGDKKYVGDEVWYVNDSGSFYMTKWILDDNNDAIPTFYKFFSTEIAAKGYQLLARLRSLHEQGLKYINEYNQ